MEEKYEEPYGPIAFTFESSAFAERIHAAVHDPETVYKVERRYRDNKVSSTQRGLHFCETTHGLRVKRF